MPQAGAERISYELENDRPSNPLARLTVPTVSVIVATRGRPHLLPNLVEAVLADPAASQMIVVVDGEDRPRKKDQPSSWAVLSALAGKNPRLVPLQIERSGQMAALEVGVSHADADIVLLLDDDVLPTCALATGHARRHGAQQGIVLVGSMPVRWPSKGRTGPATRLYAHDYDGHAHKVDTGVFGALDHLWMGNVSLRRSDCLAVGLTSSEFSASYHSDRDFGLRLAQWGLSGVRDDSLSAVHMHQRSNGAFLSDSRRHGAGLAQLHQVHREALGPFDPSEVTEDLFPPLRQIVEKIGPSPTARPIAHCLLGVGWVLGMSRWTSAETRLAQLARRIMVVHGASKGEADRISSKTVHESMPVSFVTTRYGARI